MSTVRTRFAPSPTGFMHIGGMRTALFNWLWARHNNGQFILRIDDTDRERHVEEALAPILQAFLWLGLDWDEGAEIGGPHGPYYQSQRTDLYQQAVDQLLADGKAFRDFDPPELAQEDRTKAEKAKQNYLNVRRSLDLSDAEVQQFLDEGRPHTVRLLVNRDEPVHIEDLVLGPREAQGNEIADPVLQRSNGGFLYNFATVVDDAMMHITHVIRGQEHHTNTLTQSLIYQALGYEMPAFAHIPFVTPPQNNKKMSKRDGEKYRNNPKMKRMFESRDEVFSCLGIEDVTTLNPVMVEYYERMGYLPAGVLNGLSRLGWSYDDKTEEMSLDFVVQHFDLDRVVKAPAAFDPEKLMSYQAHWMNELSLEERAAGCLPYLIQAGIIDENPDEATRNYVQQVVEVMGERIKLFSDILQTDDFFAADDQLTYDEKAFDKRIRNADGAAERLKAFAEKLATVESFDEETLDKLLHDFVEEEGIKIGEIIHAIRIGTTGKAKGPGMFEALALLGRERCLARINNTLARL